jgi:hypothetical protein
MAIIVSVLEQRVMFVSLNPDWDEQKLNASVVYNKMAKFWLILSNQILLDPGQAEELNEGLMAQDLVEGLVLRPGLEDSLVEFLDSDRPYKYLETLTLMHFAYWEPAMNGFD